MSDYIKRSELEHLLNLYESGIIEDIQNNPHSLALKEKLKTVKDIRHRILVLSRGGFKIINKQGD